MILLLGLAAGLAPWGEAALARVGGYLDGTTAVLADSIPANDIVFGPRRFDALPSGGALYVEQFSVDLRAGEFYQLKIHNPYEFEGARVDSFVLELNGSVIVTSADMGSAPYWTVPVALQASNTLELSMPADSGAMSVWMWREPDSHYALYGPETLTVASGSTTASLLNQQFGMPATAGPQRILQIFNGAEDGTGRVTGAAGEIRINGSVVYDLANLTSQVAAVIVPVTLQAANTLEVALTGSVAGANFNFRVTASDTTSPVATFTSPQNGMVVGGTEVAISGSYADESPGLIYPMPDSLNLWRKVNPGDAFTIAYPLQVEGTNQIPIETSDRAWHSYWTTFTVIRDTQAPALTVSAPASNIFTQSGTVTVSGTVTDLTMVTVNVNGTPLTVGTNGTFSGSVSLSEGANVLTVTATDAANRATSVVRTVTRDTQTPVLTISQPANGSSVSTASVTVVGQTTDATATAVTVNGSAATPTGSGGFEATVSLAEGSNTITTVATDAAANATTDVRTVTRTGSAPSDGSNIPFDANVGAPALLATAPTPFSEGTSFLYTGASPIQTGVVAGTIQPLQAAVVRGRVLNRAGTPLSGVTVRIAARTEFGQTTTRSNGLYDLAVNGGGSLRVSYEKAGYLPVERVVRVPWRDYAVAPEIVMTALDSAVTTIGFTQPIEVARGSVVSDLRGSRQATLMFEQGTIATLVMPDGSTSTRSSLAIRATEFTVGTRGQDAMPAELPALTAYTYAVDFSADEATTAGAREVQFSKPVAAYLENFLNFQVGEQVPVGYYDRSKGAWLPMANGLVIRVLSITNGRANIATDTTNTAAPQTRLDSLGITDAEREQLATLYAVGQTLWRTETSHFSIIDWNWLGRLGPDVIVPFWNRVRHLIANPCPRNGSIISCENQSLGEALDVAGTPFGLHYESSRVLGRSATMEVTVIGDSIPPSLAAIRIESSVLGRTFTTVISRGSIVPNHRAVVSVGNLLSPTDPYGRKVVLGGVPVTGRLVYVYDAVYSGNGIVPFGFGSASGAGGEIGRAGLCSVEMCNPQITLTVPFADTIRVWDARAASGLGGWSLTAHHAYDPASRTLYLGDGSTRAANGIPPVITKFAGRPGFTPSWPDVGGDSGAATAAQLGVSYDMAVRSDGALFISQGDRVRLVAPTGIITTFAGTPHQSGFGGYGDGAQASSARFGRARGIAIGPDGSLYIADELDHRVRRVSPTGVITTVAGTGTAGYAGDGGAATAAQLNSPRDVEVGADGALYIADRSNLRIRQVTPNGIIRTFAGNGQAADGAYPFEIVTARAALTSKVSYPHELALAPDGTLSFLEEGQSHVRQIGKDGRVRLVLRPTASPTTQEDGGTAFSTGWFIPEAIAYAADGSLYVGDLGGQHIRRLGPDGIVSTVIGQQAVPFRACTEAPGDTGCQLRAAGNAGSARQAKLYQTATSLAVGPDGALFLGEAQAYVVRRIAPAMPDQSLSDHVLASESGDAAYVFDYRGRHLRTVDAATGRTLLTFGYDAAGRLLSATDAFANVTTVTRNGTGNATAITGPFGQRTTLAHDARGYLASVTNALGEATRLVHDSLGLLDSLVDARGSRHAFQYVNGRLTSDEGPGGYVQTLARAYSADSLRSTVFDPAGRATHYSAWFLKGGTLDRRVKGPDGLTTRSVIETSGRTTMYAPTGMQTTALSGADPRLGLDAPFLTEFTLRSPSGLLSTIRSTRTVTLTDSTNRLSLATQLDSTVVNGRVFTRSLSMATRTAVSVTPEGRQATAVFDTLGRVTEERVPGLATTTYAYDSRGRLERVTQAGRSVRYFYDARGGTDSVTDPMGRTTRYVYDSLGQATRTVLPGAREVSFAYDSSGNLKSLTPPGRTAHQFGFTSAGLTASYTPPAVTGGGVPTAFRYNLDRSLREILRPDSSLISFAYDSAGRPRTITVPAGVTTLAYSATTGNLTGITSPGSRTLGYAYDGALPTTTTWGGEVSGSVTLGYDSLFRTASVTVNGANAIGYGYDRDGLLTSAGALTLGRNAQNGLLTTATVGGVETRWHYDSLAQADSVVTTQGGTTLMKVLYARDSIGRITTLTETVQGVTTVQGYTYDAAGRLYQVRLGGVLQSTYTYDGNGNRLQLTTPGGTVTGTYDAQDRLETYGTSSYRWAATGELRERITGTDTTRYTYDAFGNLLAVRMPDATLIEYVADGQNRRIGRKVNGVFTQRFLYQSQLAPVAELDGTGAVVSRFVYGTRVNVPDYMVRGGVTYRFVTDHLGSVRLMINTSTGAVVQQVSYDEFGRETGNSSPGFQPFGYAGGLTDSGSSLLRFGARYYEPLSGRWTSREPLGFAAGVSSQYSYADGDPINFADPDGRLPFLVGTALAGATFGLAGNLIGQTLADFNAGRPISIDWREAAIAAGVGAIGGLALPYISTLQGAAALGGTMSIAQVTLNAWLGCGASPTIEQLVTVFAFGAGGGAIGGTISRGAGGWMEGPQSFLRQDVARRLNNPAVLRANFLATHTLFTNFAAAIFGNFAPPAAGSRP